MSGGDGRAGARRLYRLLLRFGPVALVARHRDEMEALFLDTLVEARARGPLAVLTTWSRAAFDIAASSVTHLFRRRSRPPDPVPERQALMIGSDLRYTVRWLGRQKFSTSLVVAMLSLGIAATIVVFSLVNALFLRPFPFDAPDRLVYLNETAPRWNLEVVGINYPDFHQWRQAATVFEGMAMWDGNSFNLSDASGAERIVGARVTHDLAAVLRVKPLVGRMFSADEDKPGAPPVVVIGEGLWRERFGARQTVLGETLRLNGVAHPIVGVMPAAASFPRNIRLWVPFQGNPAQDFQIYGSDGAIARLKPGVSPEDAAKELLRTQQPIWEARDRDKLVSPFVRPLVNETFARTFWPGVSDPVGRRLRGTDDDAPWITVVGFVSDVKHYGLERPMRPGVYFPLRQTPARTLTVAVRTATDAVSFAGTARAVVREMDPDLAMYGIRTMEEALERSLAERTLYSWLIAVFAGMTLVLALGGTYGVLSYLVSQRTRELGIRVALGAQRADITREVLWSSFIATAGGVALGIVAAIFVARMMAELLFGVPPHDVIVLAFSAVTLIVVASLVNWFPASRAARADPMRFLRVE